MLNCLTENKLYKNLLLNHGWANFISCCDIELLYTIWYIVECLSNCDFRYEKQRYHCSNMASAPVQLNSLPK